MKLGKGEDKKLRGSEKTDFQWPVEMHLSQVYLEAHLERCNCGPPGGPWRGISYTFLLPFDLDWEKNITKAQVSSLGSLNTGAN